MQNPANELMITLLIGGTADSPTSGVARALVASPAVPSAADPVTDEHDSFALDLAERLGDHAANGQRGAAVVELHPSVDLTETALVLDAVFGELATDGTPVGLGEVIVVVSAVSARAELFDTVAGEVDFETPERLATRIELATVVVVTDCHLVSRAHLREVLGLIEKLAPRAPRLLSSGRIDPAALARHARGDRRLGIGRSAGWMRELSGRGELPTSISGISTMIFDDPRPFHPLRLAEVIETCGERDIVGQILRSRGFIRLASRPDTVGSWASAGPALTIESTSMSSWSSDSPTGQQLVFYGKGLQHETLVNLLSAALLADDEFIAGPMEWATYVDPFPVWHDAEAEH